jgi:hypothetical protein
MVRTKHKVAKGKFVFAIRNKRGQFTDIQSIGKAVKADARKKSKHKVKSGFGYLGDIKVKAYRRG